LMGVNGARRAGKDQALDVRFATQHLLHVELVRARRAAGSSRPKEQ